MNRLLKAEKKIRNKENKQGLAPYSVKTFEKALLSSPNSSYLWVKYAAYVLEGFGADKAREIFEAAVEKVDSTEEREKLNVYLAWMNFENHFGTEETFLKATSKALNVNSIESVLRHKALKHLQKGQMEDCEEAFKYLCKKFAKNLRNWEDLLKFYLVDLKNEDKFEECLKRGLQVHRDSVELRKKVASLYYEIGESEKGKTLFENLVSEKPKRSDLWTVYIQLEEKKAGGVEVVRDLYERVMYSKLSPKTFKTIAKKYYEFELRNNNQEKANEIANRFNIMIDP